MKRKYEWIINEKFIWMKDEFKVYLGEYWMKRIYKRMMNEKDIWSNEWWMNYINKW